MPERATVQASSSSRGLWFGSFLISACLSCLARQARKASADSANNPRWGRVATMLQYRIGVVTLAAEKRERIRSSTK
jgi:hypothetical protein